MIDARVEAHLAEKEYSLRRDILLQAAHFIVDIGSSEQMFTRSQAIPGYDGMEAGWQHRNHEIARIDKVLSPLIVVYIEGYGQAGWMLIDLTLCEREICIDDLERPVLGGCMFQ